MPEEGVDGQLSSEVFCEYVNGIIAHVETLEIETQWKIRAVATALGVMLGNSMTDGRESLERQLPVQFATIREMAEYMVAKAQRGMS